jgi:uncharacterized membrane protein
MSTPDVEQRTQSSQTDAAAPSSAQAADPHHVAPAVSRVPFPTIRANLPLSAPIEWLAKGWQDILACKAASLFYGLSFAGMGWLMVLAFSFAVHLISGVVTGFMLVGPFLAIGLYALSRQREAGEPIRLVPTLTAWKTTRGAIGIYSMILIIIYLVWARASMVVFALFYEGGMPSIASFIGEIARFEDIEFLLTYVVMGGIFAGLVFSLSLVSIPLMLDRDQDAVTAMIASVIALGRNAPAVMVWGFLILLLIGLGMATGFFGLILTGPLVGHATWHAYRSLVEPLPNPPIEQTAVA